MEVDIGDIAAVVALLFSGFTYLKQRRLDEKNALLSDLLIEKEKSESVASKSADLSANFVERRKNNWVLRIFNRGDAGARNIRLEVAEGGGLIDETEKFPYPRLDRHQSFDVGARVYIGSARRATFKLIWDDDAGGGEKELTCDVH